MSSYSSEPAPNWSDGRIVQPALPAGTTTGTWGIWVMSLLPLLGPVELLISNPLGQMRSQLAQLHAIDQSPGTFHAVANPFTPAFLANQAVAIVLLAVQVLLAVADRRALARRGVVRPFHWAWAFLQPVYVIGRAVVVRRRTGGGLAPLWVWIGCEALALTAAGVVIAQVFSAVFAAVR